jgi:hypothetical protein
LPNFASSDADTPGSAVASRPTSRRSRPREHSKRSRSLPRRCATSRRSANSRPSTRRQAQPLRAASHPLRPAQLFFANIAASTSG